MTYYSILVKTPLFNSVGEDELERIFSELKITESRFKKGSVVAMQDEPVNRLIILLRGSVKGEMIDWSGRVMKVEDIKAPGPLAILFLFGKDNRFPVQVTAIENVEAVVIPRESVLRMLTMNEAILKNYLEISADFASRLSKKLHVMSFHTIRQKVAMYLLDRSKATGSNAVELDRTKTALAEYFGVSRPSLERELTNMHNEGLIDAGKRKIVISAREALIRIVNY